LQHSVLQHLYTSSVVLSKELELCVHACLPAILPISPAIQVKVSSWLRSGLAAVTAIVVTWRFARSSISRFAASLLDHKRRRRAVLREMAELQQRVDILHALTSSMPQALQQQQQQQQQQLAGQQAGSSSTAAAATAGGAFGGISEQQQQQQQQRGEQFVVVDLPRVESGGFALLSPAATSPTPDLAGAQQAAAAFAAASTATTGAAAAAGAVDSKAVAAAVQQQMVGTAAMVARSAGSQRAVAGSSAFTSLPQQQPVQQQQQQHQQQESVPSASSSTRSSLEQRQPQRSAFAVPLPSMIMSGWGGVVMQQEQRAHQAPGQSTGQTAAAAAAAAVGTTDPAAANAAGAEREGDASAAAAAAGRLGSSDSEGQGEWVERPSCFDSGELLAGVAAGGGSGGIAAERVSPHSSTSSEGVLLERE
jgi:hypothetical protein